MTKFVGRKVEIKKNHKFLNELIQEKITYFKDENIRREIKLVKGEKKNLENFVRYLIPKCLPSSLVETFESLYKKCYTNHRKSF